MPKAPHQIKFQLIGRDAILQTLTAGLMKVHVQDLPQSDVEALANFLGGAVASSEPVKQWRVTRCLCLPHLS